MAATSTQRQEVTPQPHSVRTVPMKVLCLGYGRTGTTSIREALLILGFRHAYHTSDAVYVNPYDCKKWLGYLKAKSDGVGKLPGREEFDQLLGHCQAVADMPAAYFAPELIKAYPEAKVILTVRDMDEWHKSVKNTLQVADTSLVTAVLGFTSKLLFMSNRWNYPMFQTLDRLLYNHDFDRNGRASLQRHYTLVRSLVPPERLLEYHVSEGWEPLCRFLDCPVPSASAEQTEMPFTNKSSDFEQKFRKRNLTYVKAQLRRVMDVSAYAALVAVLVKLMANVPARWPVLK